MGIELVIGAASLALGVLSFASNAGTAAAAASDRKQSADASTASNNIQIAQQENNSIYDRRSRIREQRVRQAQMEQGAANTGTNGSSSEAGGIGSLDSNFSALIGQSSGQDKANSGINRLNQTAAGFDESARTTLAWNDVFQSGIKTGQTIFDNWPKT